MKVQRDLALSSLAVMLITIAPGSAIATSDVALNLQYDNPSLPAAGGTWELVVKTDNALGIAGLSAYLTNAGTTADFTSPYLGTTPAFGDVQVLHDFSGTLNVVFGFDLDGSGDEAGVGTGVGTNGNQPVDPLGDAAWNNVALIASGTFGSSLPAFVDDSPGLGDTTSVNVHTAASLAGTGGAASDPIGLLVVRVPEPTTLSLLAFAGLVTLRRRRR